MKDGTQREVPEHVNGSVGKADEAYRANEAELLARALSWIQDRYVPAVTPAQEPLLDHCQGTSEILASLQTDMEARVAALLLALPAAPVPGGGGLDPLGKAFGADVARLVQGTRALLRLGDVAREANATQGSDSASQKEMMRKMLLAMAADLRIVLIRLASRLQTLRWHAKSKLPCDPEFARETFDLYAPLANRLGIWQIKWEMEDLAFRFLHPAQYREIAGRLEEKRNEREAFIDRAIEKLKGLLAQAGVSAQITGRPKHIYSIWNKMRKKDVDFLQLYDLRALRVIVADERNCYLVLGIVHEHWSPIGQEFDDYITRPKPNGYRSLHTVVAAEDGRAFEVQIRTQAMHEFAEHGMAAHWRYKEGSAPGGQAAASGTQDRQLAWMRQLLAWQSDTTPGSAQPLAPVSDQAAQIAQAAAHIYVLSPQARVVELPQGATPIDFAYHLHTDLGHRCRGAKIDGQMVPLSTRLQTGQTVEVITTKAGGPSRDWLNPQLNYLASNRARAKVRAWFNAIELQQRITQGQSLVEKELQRLGKTAVNLEQLAQQMGFANADDFYVAVSKEDVGLRQIDALFQPPSEPVETSAESMVSAPKHIQGGVAGGTGVLVQGVGSLMTQLARCCRPAPPDAIGGFITRGRGVSVHRHDCGSFQQLLRQQPERAIDVAWGETGESLFPVDVVVRAHDRPALLRDLSEVFARLRLNVIGVNTQSKGSLAHMVFTVQVEGGQALSRVIQALADVPGVLFASRR